MMWVRVDDVSAPVGFFEPLLPLLESHAPFARVRNGSDPILLALGLNTTDEPFPSLPTTRDSPWGTHDPLEVTPSVFRWPTSLLGALRAESSSTLRAPGHLFHPPEKAPPLSTRR